MTTLQATIDQRDTEIEKLKHRQYDEEHRSLAQRKVNALTEESKDLIYFLLHHGEMETEELRKHCQNPTHYDSAIQQTRGEGLVRPNTRESVGRSGVHYFWQINPTFEAVLKDLLGKREPRYFL